MNVRKFTAPRISEALAKVKSSLGDDAVILRTRKARKGGLLSFLYKEVVEVMAASPDRNPTPESPLADRAAEARSKLQSHTDIHAIRDLRDEIGDLNTSVVASYPGILITRESRLVAG